MYPDGATFEPASGKCWAEFGWDYIDAGHGNGDKYVSCSFHPNVCTFILGESHLDEGVGEKEEYIGNFDTPRECVAEVLQWNYGRKHWEQIANGVTWGTYNGVIGIGSKLGECYAEIGWTGVTDRDTAWITCGLPTLEEVCQDCTGPKACLSYDSHGTGLQCIQTLDCDHTSGAVSCHPPNKLPLDPCGITWEEPNCICVCRETSEGFPFCDCQHTPP